MIEYFWAPSIFQVSGRVQGAACTHHEYTDLLKHMEVLGSDSIALKLYHSHNYVW